MLAQFQTEALKHLKRELNGLGYVGSLIQEDYEIRRRAVKRHLR